MEPIISPMFFYWVEVVNSLVITFLTIGIFLFVPFFVCTVCYIYAKNIDYCCISEKDMIKIRKAWKFGMKISSISILFILISIFLPTKETLIRMEIAKNITPQNVTILKGEVKNVVDYMFEKVNKIQSR